VTVTITEEDVRFRRHLQQGASVDAVTRASILVRVDRLSAVRGRIVQGIARLCSVALLVVGTVEDTN
jgi:hypothetical protein